MIAVDLWAPQPGHDEVPGGQSYEGNWQHDHHFANFSAHVAREFPNRVQVIRECSWEAADHVADGVLDFVFIDADHSYDAVCKDIKAWRPKVRGGGLISGHDYEWPTVANAVHDTLGGEVIVAGDSCWMKYVK